MTRKNDRFYLSAKLGLFLILTKLFHYLLMLNNQVLLREMKKR